MALRHMVTTQLGGSGIGTTDKGRQRSTRSGRGGRGNRSGSTPRGQGSHQRSSPTQRTGTVSPGMSGARHYNNLGGRRPFGSNMERLDVYLAHMGKKQQWPKVYVEGIPTNVTLLGREGIPAIKALIEDILDWPLAEGTEFRLAEAVHMREFPTEHGRGAGTTYGLILDLGRREIEGMSVYPDFGAYHEAPCTRLRNRCVRRQY